MNVMTVHKSEETNTYHVTDQMLDTTSQQNSPQIKPHNNILKRWNQPQER